MQANPSLAALITSKFGNDDWLLDATKLQGLSQYAEDLHFQKEWNEIKVRACDAPAKDELIIFPPQLDNKRRLATYIELTLGIPINRDALFDVMSKRIHEYKRCALRALDCTSARLYRRLTDGF